MMHERALTFVIALVVSLSCNSARTSHFTQASQQHRAQRACGTQCEKRDGSLVGGTEILPAPTGLWSLCSDDERCPEQLHCLNIMGEPRCSTRCESVSASCPLNGTCIDTLFVGRVCAPRCTQINTCQHVDVEFSCNPVWKACMPADLSTIMPRRCPSDPGQHDNNVVSNSERVSSRALGDYEVEPSAVINAKGSIVIMYTVRSISNGYGRLFVTTRSEKGTSETRSLDGTRHRSNTSSRIAQDRSGKLYAVWIGEDVSREIGFATSVNGAATWQVHDALDNPEDCKGGGPCPDRPLIAVGPDPLKPSRDLVYAIYSSSWINRHPGMRVRVSRDYGRSFSQPKTADNQGVYGNAVASRDGLHIVSVNEGLTGAFGRSPRKVRYSVSKDGGRTFANPITISEPHETIPFFFTNPSIAVDFTRKKIYVAYVREDDVDKWSIMIAVSSDGGVHWERRLLHNECALLMVPNLALDELTGDLHVLWYDTGTPSGRFVHGTCSPSLARCETRGAVNTVPFTSLSLARLGSSWVGDSQDMLIDSQRRLLHSVWTQPVDDNGQSVSRIHHGRVRIPTSGRQLVPSKSN
jgi:hypothetical protein